MNRLDMPKMYGTLAYRLMLATNMLAGFRTVWMPPEYKIAWVRVPLYCVCGHLERAHENGCACIGDDACTCTVFKSEPMS